MILIKDGKIYTITGETIENGSVLIKDGKIQEVGKDIKCPEKARIIDAKGKIVMPGFIDAHCHLGIFEEGIGFEGSDGNESVDPVTPHLRAIDAINPMDISLREAYEGGVTTAITGPGSANVSCLCTRLVDKRMDFNGYNPTNINGVYQGSISLYDALVYSIIKIKSSTGKVLLEVEEEGVVKEGSGKNTALDRIFI